MFICIEGVDASGKNTQAQALADKLTRNGRHVSLYSFPRYETPVGKSILALLKGQIGIHEQRAEVDDTQRDPFRARETETEALALQALMTVDKLDAAVHINRLLRAGQDVVCDRWTPSAECYGAADGLPREWIERIQSSLPKADFYFYLAVSEEEALHRRPKLRDRYELDRNKQQTVRKLYGDTWISNMNNSPGGHWIIIDGHGTPDEVTQRIWDCMYSRAVI